jgi:hypothetical protein
MPFIHTYTSGMKVLAEIGTGTCNGTCKSSWIRNLKYALKTKTNPLKLTASQRKTMTAKIKSVSGRNATNNHAKTLKKYSNRPSPPYPANKNCNTIMKGNDGNMYKSNPNKNNVCTWTKVK